ncbi:hypothetical protein TKK_0015562 [Trichogramma kaykai]
MNQSEYEEVDINKDKLKINDLKSKNEKAEVAGDLKVDDDNAEVVDNLIINSVNEREKKFTVDYNEINTEKNESVMVDIERNKLEIVGIENGKLKTPNVEKDEVKNVKDKIDKLDYSGNDVLIIDEDDELNELRTELLIKDQIYYDDIVLEQEQYIDPCEEVYKHYDASENKLDFCLERILHIDQAHDTSIIEKEKVIESSIPRVDKVLRALSLENTVEEINEVTDLVR